ncbi:MAG: hypothetical protein LBG90_00210 [Spirochaetaceae bacterium]|nr:hypothetical protein [Spirochaetaceae bacterium]
MTVYYNGKKQDTPLTPAIKPLNFQAGSWANGTTAPPAFNTVVYGGNTWYAGAKSTTGNVYMVYSSSDLSSWSGVGPTGNVTEITAGLYAHDTFVLAYTWNTNRATIGYSINPNGNPAVNSMVSPGTGVNSRFIYSGGTEQAGNIARIKGLAFGKDQFVAVGNVGMVARSNAIRSNTDVPNAWEVATSVAPFYRAGSINCVIFDETKFIAGGGTGGTTTSPINIIGQIITSTDGFNWTTSTNTNVSGEIKSMAYCKDFGGKYVLVTKLTDNYGFIYHSTDGLTWTSINNNSALTGIVFNAVAYNGDGLFVAVGKSGNVGKIAYSVDGENWNLYAPPSTNTNPPTFNQIEFTAVAGNDKGEFVVVGNNSNNQGKIFYSKLD